MNVHAFISKVDLLLALSDANDVTQDFLFSCFFNSPSILKAIKTCNVCFYFTNNENYCIKTLDSNSSAGM